MFRISDSNRSILRDASCDPICLCEELLPVLLRRGAWVRRLQATTAGSAIEELGAALRESLGGLEARAIRAVLDREATAATGLGDDVAVPHAVVAGLTRPLVALGFAPDGIDFNAPDGQPAKIIFLMLIPPRAHDQEVRILAQIARAAIESKSRERLLKANSLPDVLALLGSSLAATATPRRRTSLADI